MSTATLPATARRWLVKPSVLPGLGLTLGFSVFYLSLLVLLPLSALIAKSSGLGWEQFWRIITAPDVLASFRLTFGAALAAALINSVIGFMTAWVLVRYRFPGRGLLDAVIDLPFALPTAVAGLALTALYGPQGWIGRWLASYDIQIVFTPAGVTLALVFISLPFVVRTVQPVLEDLGTEIEEAAGSLGANRWQIVTRIIMPQLLPALLTGFALAFARALGEYGSVVFISGNLPLKTEIVAHVIIGKLENYDYAAATAIAVVMLVLSFALLLTVNLLQRALSRKLE
jgi:sulfate transport system permease protein